ncbi:MAG: LPS assembly lipoprotein LptE [Deltaproteobacteria bacterium]|jgi:outer membrane lipopolysaccharide assembly protein LptE/RlpB
MRDKLQLWVRHAATLLVSSGMLLGATGCGYQLAGQSLLLSQDIRRIYVEPFISRSRDVGIDKELTSALRSEFYRRGQLKVVDQLDQADAIVSGVIRSLDSHVASVNRKDEVLQWESVMVLDVSLRRREPNEILWRAQGARLTQIFSGSRAAVVTTSSEFRTGTLNSEDIRQMTDIQLTESDKQRVRDQLIEGFAQQLHQRLLEMF